MTIRIVCAAAALLATLTLTPALADTARPRPPVATCERDGGTLLPARLGPICAIPEPDAGAPCTDSAQCSGACLADTRTCAPLYPMTGCYSYLDQGETFEICVD